MCTFYCAIRHCHPSICVCVWRVAHVDSSFFALLFDFVQWSWWCTIAISQSMSSTIERHWTHHQIANDDCASERIHRTQLKANDKTNELEKSQKQSQRQWHQQRNKRGSREPRTHTPTHDQMKNHELKLTSNGMMDDDDEQWPSLVFISCSNQIVRGCGHHLITLVANRYAIQP